MSGEETMDVTDSGVPPLSATVQSQIALALMADEGNGLALAAQHQLDRDEAYALRDRLVANADEVFSSRAETLALELAVCRAELARLVQLAESRRISAILHQFKDGIAMTMTGLRSRLFRMALPLARRLPEPVKAHLNRWLR